MLIFTRNISVHHGGEGLGEVRREYCKEGELIIDKGVVGKWMREPEEENRGKGGLSRSTASTKG
jgi:hypothetical protein